MEETTKTAVIPVEIEPTTNGNGNGHHALLPTSEFPIAKQISNEQLIAEEKFLIKEETAVENNYHGLRCYWRIFQVTQVIGKLSLFLYLDQYDVHHKAQQKQAARRKQTAARLTRLAYYGEMLYGVRLWFLHMFMLMLRSFFLGSETNREINQEKQAVWLKEKLIELGPTFIKMGQSMGTRADLLPLPFVKELGTLVDQVPAFPNDVAYGIIERELGRKIS